MKRAMMFAGLAAMLSFCGAAFANETGEVILLGTDAVSLHGDTTFAAQLNTSHLGSNVAYITDFGCGFSGSSCTTMGSGGTTVTQFSSLGAAESFGLGSFTGVFIASPSQCCSDPMTDSSLGLTTGNLNVLADFVNDGGDVAIENFQGRAGWQPLLGFFPAAGVLSGPTGVGCADYNVSTAEGISEGFTGNPSGGTNTYYDGCFQHQTYDPGFFGAHGYNSLIGGGFGDMTTSSVEESDGRVGTPEPATLLLLGSGLVGVISRKRKK